MNQRDAAHTVLNFALAQAQHNPADLTADQMERALFLIIRDHFHIVDYVMRGNALRPVDLRITEH